MPKRLKRRAIIGLLLALPLLLAGCNLRAVVQTVRNAAFGAAEQGAEMLDVVFATGPEIADTLTEPDFVDFPVSRRLYDGLNGTQQAAYRAVYNAVFSQPEKIRIPKLTEEEISAVMLALKLDNPFITCLDTSYSYSYVGDIFVLQPDYVSEPSVSLARSRQLVDEAKLLLRTYMPSAETPFEKELLIHDALCERCVYGDGPLSATAYGALVEGRAVCEGYALAAKLLFDLLGLESVTVRGSGVRDGRTELHMWNAVRLDSGWYYVDCTWDDPVTENGEDTVRHFYFNLTEEALRRDHTDFTPPPGVVCAGTEENYFRKLDLYCTAENWEAVARRVISGAKAGEQAELQFESASLLETAAEALFKNGGINVYGAGTNWRRYGYAADPDTNGLFLRFYES